MVPILDKYPEIERSIRGDGSPKAIGRCMEPVIARLPEFKAILEEIALVKQLKFKEVFLFQSRAAGTCKPTADFDFYVQLEEKHREMVEGNGVDYKDTGVKLICGEWATKFFSEPDSGLLERMRVMKMDVFLGIDPLPPAKREYRGEKYYVRINELVG